MNCVQPRGQGISTERERWAFEYLVCGDLRFISHQDTLRLFERALARAALPVRYTEGFNPHPRLSIPVPRPVGVASSAETIIVEFQRPIDHDEALCALDRQVPEGIEMTGARRLRPGERLQPSSVRYTLEMGEASVDEVKRHVLELQDRQSLKVERFDSKSGRKRSIDARSFLEEIRVTGGAVEFSIRVTPQGTIKPAEIAGLLGYDARWINHRIRRLEVRWQ